MPLQNRVGPDGAPVAVPQRGTLMGNRGRLHDADRRIRRRWTTRRWISCELDFHDRHRTVLATGRYTELFFLDEVTALAAGHRPCGECRRAALRAWRGSLAGTAWDGAPLDALDAELHAERTGDAADPVDPATLPAWTVVRDGDRFVALAPAGPLAWSFDGYAPTRLTGGPAVPATPALAVAALRGGYRPQVHPSAG